jgi:hypothetical protein
MTYLRIDTLRPALQTIHDGFDADGFLAHLGEMVASLESAAATSSAPEA